MPVDTLVYSGGAWNIIRPTTIEGYCSGIYKGSVNVALNVGPCGSGFSGKLGNSYTGWNSVSRIIVQEVDPPQ